MNRLYKIFTSLIIIAFVFIACEDKSDLTAPDLNTGSADFTRFVAIGNSLTAGYQNGSLYESAQEYSFGAQIAMQVGATTFVQPLISEPGIPGKLEITELIVQNGDIADVVLGPNTGTGAPMNSDYSAPFNNLGIPGAIVFDMADTTDFGTKSTARGNPFFSLVLRSALLGNSQLTQATAQQPTFMTLWMGNNDVLGYATSGGTKGTDATGTLPTDANVFAFLYNQVVTALAATGAKVVVGNIPDVKSAPFFTTVSPPVGATLEQLSALIPTIQGLVYQTSAAPFIGLASINDLKTNVAMMLLTGSSFAPLLGDTTGAYYAQTGIPVPPTVNTQFPFGLTPQNPWPNEYILDPAEQTLVNNAIQSFNNTISGLVAANSANFALMDFNSFLNDVSANDFQVNGLSFTTEFLSGGLFSLDGIHLTSQGYAIVANKFIEKINSSFSANIPLINVSTVPGSIDLAKISAYKKIFPLVEPGALEKALFPLFF